MLVRSVLKEAVATIVAATSLSCNDLFVDVTLLCGLMNCSPKAMYIDGLQKAQRSSVKYEVVAR